MIGVRMPIRELAQIINRITPRQRITPLILFHNYTLHLQRPPQIDWLEDSAPSKHVHTKKRSSHRTLPQVIHAAVACPATRIKTHVGQRDD